MNNINILMSVNKSFLEHVEELIFSLLHYSSRPLNIYLMYIKDELKKEDLEKIKAFVNNVGNGKVIPILFDATSLEGMPVTDNDGGFFGIESYSRLLCAYKVPEEVEKILYLDADMICTGDISELYDLEFDGKIWIACEDGGIEEKDLIRLALPLDYKYVNSGMLLIDIKKIRENYTEKEMVKMIRDNQKVLVYPDQDFINKMFRNNIKIVNCKYNLIAKGVRYTDLEEKPLIIHYAGSTKPWHDNVSRFEVEYIIPYYESMRLQGNDKKIKLENLIEKHKMYGYRNNRNPQSI